jgi:hypothetical protein
VLRGSSAGVNRRGPRSPSRRSRPQAWTLGLPWAAGIAGALSVFGLGYGLARWIYTSVVGRIHPRIDQLADTLEGHVRERFQAKEPELP